MIETVAGASGQGHCRRARHRHGFHRHRRPCSVARHLSEARPASEEFCQSILAACRAAKVACGIFTTNAEAAAWRAAEGYDLVVVANDLDVIGRGFRDAQEAFAKGLAEAAQAAPVPADKAKPTGTKSRASAPNARAPRPSRPASRRIWCRTKCAQRPGES